jgi:hypothetical protein
MAQQTKSTHRGHCQVCGRLQAVMSVSGVLAKHGYQVKGWGYFHGVCQGSDTYPLEHDRTLCDRICETLTSHAAEQAKAAEAFRTGKQTPQFVWGKYLPEKRDYERIDWAQGTELQQRDEVNRLVWLCENEARHARAHVDCMQKLAARVHGQALVEIKKVERVVPVQPTVDVEAGKVTGVYATKAARQADLNKLQREYEACRKVLSNLYLRSPDRHSDKEATSLYYGVSSLSQWRPKHSALALRLYPQAAEVVQRIEALAKTREAVKNAQ